MKASADSLTQAWQEQGRSYAEAFSAVLANDLAEGRVGPMDPPEDPRRSLLPRVLEALREANRGGATEAFRAQFPPAWELLWRARDSEEESNEPEQPIGPILLLDDARLVFRVGAPEQRSRTVVAHGADLVPLPDILCVGRSPNREWFAVAREEHVEIRRGWDGPLVRTFPWPTEQERVLSRYQCKTKEGAPPITEIIPFPDGRRALLVSSEGIFVLDENQATLVHPSDEAREAYFAWHHKQFPGEDVDAHLDMEHGAISGDGRHIAVGAQDGSHRILDDTLTEIASIGSLSEYPHHAVFSADGQQVALNSCHFYGGITLGVPRSLVPGLVTKPGKRHRRTLILDRQCRVYASATRHDEYIFGDAAGILRCCDVRGRARWWHSVGSTISGMDISPDGKTLAAGTWGGSIHVLDLETPSRDPYAVGTSTHCERYAWLFLPGESTPLRW